MNFMFIFSIDAWGDYLTWNLYLKISTSIESLSKAINKPKMNFESHNKADR